MSFEEKIQKWVTLDNQHRLVSDKAKQLRDQKHALEDDIFQYISANNLTNTNLNITDGRLKFTNVKQSQPLTLKYIEQCLLKCIKNEEHVKQIMTYIKESRNVKYTQDIKRFYANN